VTLAFLTVVCITSLAAVLPVFASSLLAAIDEAVENTSNAEERTKTNRIDAHLAVRVQPLADELGARHHLTVSTCASSGCMSRFRTPSWQAARRARHGISQVGSPGEAARC
jgi:hypothetical protein